HPRSRLFPYTTLFRSHFRTDGGAWQTYASPFTSPSDGSHTIDYYSTDSSGNSEVIRTVALKIDSTAPSSSVQLAGTQAVDGSYIDRKSTRLNSSHDQI